MGEHPFLTRVRSVDLTVRSGRVRRILPTHVEADGPNVPLGAMCTIESETPGPGSVMAEVVGVNADSVILAPFDTALRTFSGARVEALASRDQVPVGDALLGRALDGLGRPIDGKGALQGCDLASLSPLAPAPLDRISPRRVFETGIRAVDAFLTLAEGQRVGIFAASGVGKTSLLTQLCIQAKADRCVICLVGERGREVEALWSEGLSAEARSRTTLIAATSDDAAAMRVRAGDYALTVAEQWRDRGLHVLLVIDSVTRLAMAMRETGLAAGEPPTLRAYPPRVFAAIPKLVERCGALRAGGAITSVMTVLSESDDIDDPISEMLKSLLDGHIVLSRPLAERGHYPAIDVPRSISRLARSVMAAPHRSDAQEGLSLLSTFDASRTLIESGVYVRGASPEIDRAIERRPALLQFLKQGQGERTTMASAIAGLSVALRGRS